MLIHSNVMLQVLIFRENCAVRAVTVFYSQNSQRIHSAVYAVIGKTFITLLKLWLRAKQTYLEIILKLSQRSISHLTTSEADIELFQPLKEF